MRKRGGVGTVLSLAGLFAGMAQQATNVPAPAFGGGAPDCLTVGKGNSTAGIESHTVESAYQNGKQEIRVLLPDNYSTSRLYRVLYVLPVEADFQQRFGYGLGVLQEMNAHNLYDLIIVQMGFEKEPWFGDHANDRRTRQASYLKEFVVPFIEARYSTIRKPEGRLLLGFSKGGWGAFSLILADPGFFGYAAAWDAPLFLTAFHFGMKDVFGTPEQFAAYRPDLLIPKKRTFFQNRTRLVLAGENYWGKFIPAPAGGSHTQEAHQLLAREGIKHVYDDSLDAPHRWDKQWMTPILAALMRLADKDGQITNPPINRFALVSPPG